MANFRIPAWKYNYVREVCSDGSLKTQEIQIPYISLENAKPPIIARYLEQKNAAYEVFLIRDLSTIVDDLGRSPTPAEAHGAIVGPNEQSFRPVWVFEDGGDINLEPPYYVDVFDLNDYDQLKVKASTICWVPHLEDSSGNLITLLKGFPKPTKSKTLGVRVLIQKPGNPEATKLAWKPVTELRGNCRELDSNTKRILFEDQLAALRAWLAQLAPPEPTVVDPVAPVEEIRTILQENMDSLRWSSMRRLPTPDASEDPPSGDDAYSDWTDVDRSNTPVSNSSDEEMVEELSDDEALAPRSIPWYCCKYARLGPTLSNHGKPEHRHGSDEECALGSDHDQHCIFADAYPRDCVIPEVESEDGNVPSHTHCLPRIAADYYIIDINIALHDLLHYGSDQENEAWNGEHAQEERARLQTPPLTHSPGQGLGHPEDANVPSSPALVPDNITASTEPLEMESSIASSGFMDIDNIPEMSDMLFDPNVPSSGHDIRINLDIYSPPPPAEDTYWQ